MFLQTKISSELYSLILARFIAEIHQWFESSAKANKATICKGLTSLRFEFIILLMLWLLNMLTLWLCLPRKICYRLTVQYSMLLHIAQLQMMKIRSHFELTKDTITLPHGRAMGVFRELFWKKWPRGIGSTLYRQVELEMVIFGFLLFSMVNILKPQEGHASLIFHCLHSNFS